MSDEVAGDPALVLELPIVRVPLVPEIALHLAWRDGESAHGGGKAAWMERLVDVSDGHWPFWWFAWPGGQALARHVLDNPALVAGRRVLDFASGCGLAAIACARAGAKLIEASDTDPRAVAAIAVNAALNNVPSVLATTEDLVGVDSEWDLIIAGDIAYGNLELLIHASGWLHRLARTGTEVWIADVGRRELPWTGAELSAEYTVASTAVDPAQFKEDVFDYRVKLLRLPPAGNFAATSNFIRRHTAPAQPPLVPEITLQLASEITPIWKATESWLDREGMAPPFWAFAWPGSVALARRVLDEPGLVAGRRVLDFGAGCGLAGIACAKAGAASVEAAEVDLVADAAIALNAGLNGVAVTVSGRDVVGEACRWDLILCGDVCYEAPMTRHVLPWLRAMAREAEVLVADPGRAYAPADAGEAVATLVVPTTLELEDRTEREVTILRLRPA